MLRKHALPMLMGLFGSLAIEGGASADATPSAGEAKARADAAFDQRRYGDALDGYRAALSATHDPLLHYNIAQSLAFLERYPEALASYQRFIAEAPPGRLSEAQLSALFARVDEIKSRIVRLEVTSNVAGARVLVRDKQVGLTPIDGALAVNAGPAKVEIIADGYKPFVAEMTLPGGGTQSVEARLERVDFSGTLSVLASAASAEVVVDGLVRGSAPVQIKLERGSHVVAVRARDMIEQSETVQISAGERTQVSFSLRPKPDYSLAYFGFTLGALGVGGGAVTGALAISYFDSAKNQCDNIAKECGPAGQDDLRTSRLYGTLSTVAFSVGVAGAAVGTYGVLRAPRGGNARPAISVALTPAGIAVRGGF